MTVSLLILVCLIISPIPEWAVDILKKFRNSVSHLYDMMRVSAYKHCSIFCSGWDGEVFWAEVINCKFKFPPIPLNWCDCNPAKFKVFQLNKRKNWCAGRSLIWRKHASLEPLFGSLIQFRIVLQTGSVWCNPYELIIIWITYQWSTTPGARLNVTASASSAKRSWSSDFPRRLGGVVHDIVRAVRHYTLDFWHAALMNTAALNDARLWRHCLYCQYNSHNWLILHSQCCPRIDLYSWLSRYWVPQMLFTAWKLVV